MYRFWVKTELYQEKDDIFSLYVQVRLLSAFVSSVFAFCFTTTTVWVMVQFHWLLWISLCQPSQVSPWILLVYKQENSSSTFTPLTHQYFPDASRNYSSFLETIIQKDQFVLLWAVITRTSRKVLTLPAWHCRWMTAMRSHWCTSEIWSMCEKLLDHWPFSHILVQLQAVASLHLKCPLFFLSL